LSRISVLHIVAGLDIGASFGGAERSGLELARALDRDAFDVRVCAFWRCDTDAERGWQTRLASEQIPLAFATDPGARRNSADFIAGAHRIAQLCRAQPVDIVHGHHEGGALACLLARRRGGARYAMRTVHVPLDDEWGRGMTASLLRAIFSRMVFPLALDAEVCVAPHFQERLKRRWATRWSGQRPHMIYNSRPLAVRPVDERRVRQGGRGVIGSIGRLTDQKGYGTLIDALPRVRERIPQAQIVLIGDGDRRGELERQARRLGVEASVRFLGQRDDASELLGTLDVFALPSLWEGIPTALLECIAAGVPVVASDVPGNRDLIEGGASGWLVPPQDAGALADALIAALLDRQRAYRYACAAQASLARFSMPAIAGQYQQLYRGLVAS
jgi:glycosyltransferase involved in cell wall biosynthesis